MTKKKKKIIRKIINGVTTVFLALLIVLLIFMFIARASGHSVSIFGLSLFRVSSGSMEPALMTGDVILVQKTSVDNIHEGDIISYQAEKGDMAGKVVTHRVITEPKSYNGKTVLQTKGDANGEKADPAIYAEQIVGKYQATLPLIGKLYSFFLTPVGLVTIIVVIVALFGFEMISLMVSYKSLDDKFDEYSESLMAEIEKNQTETEDEPAAKQEDPPQKES